VDGLSESPVNPALKREHHTSLKKNEIGIFPAQNRAAGFALLK